MNDDDQLKDAETAYAAYLLLPDHIKQYISAKEAAAAQGTRSESISWMSQFRDPPGYAASLPEWPPEIVSTLPDEHEMPIHYPGGKPFSYTARFTHTPRDSEADTPPMYRKSK
jgi:hypothetical protein